MGRSSGLTSSALHLQLPHEGMDENNIRLEPPRKRVHVTGDLPNGDGARAAHPQATDENFQLLKKHRRLLRQFLRGSTPTPRTPLPQTPLGLPATPVDRRKPKDKLFGQNGEEYEVIDEERTSPGLVAELKMSSALSTSQVTPERRVEAELRARSHRSSSSAANAAKVKDEGLQQHLEADGSISADAISSVVNFMERTQNTNDRRAALSALRATSKDPARLQKFVDHGGLAIVQRCLEDVLFEPGISEEFLVQGVTFLQGVPLTTEKIYSMGLRKVIEDLRDYLSLDAARSLLEQWDALEAEEKKETEEKKASRLLKFVKAEKDKDDEDPLSVRVSRSIGKAASQPAPADSANPAAPRTREDSPPAKRNNDSALLEEVVTETEATEEPEATLQQLDKLIALLEKRNSNRGSKDSGKHAKIATTSAATRGRESNALRQASMKNSKDSRSQISEVAPAKSSKELGKHAVQASTTAMKIKRETSELQKKPVKSNKELGNSMNEASVAPPVVLSPAAAAIAPAGIPVTLPGGSESKSWNDRVGGSGEDAYMGTVLQLGANGEGGLLDCDETRAQFDCEVFLPAELATNLAAGDSVVFHVEVGPDGLPEARDVQKVDGML